MLFTRALGGNRGLCPDLLFTNKLKLEKVKCPTQGPQKAWDFCLYFRSISTGPLHPCALTG